MSKGVVLALGGGGARGFAHIGVIEELEKTGFTIRAIAGTSMGAMVGGMYAAGAMKKFSDFALGLTIKELRGLVDLTLSPKGILKGEKIFETLSKEGIPDCNIENLSVPFMSVATDLITGETVLLRKGPLFEAIRASIAIPNLFTPVIKDQMKLMDGGITCPLPVQYMKRIQSDDLIVAVNLSGKGPAPVFVEPFDQSAKSGWMKIFSRFPDKLKPEFQFEYIMQAQQAIELMQVELARLSIACYPPDMVIEIPYKTAHLFEFHRAAEICGLGRAATRKALQKSDLH